MTNIGFGDTMHVLHNTLNLREEKQQVISSNIANADTPGFAPSRLNFEQELKNSISDSNVTLVSSNPEHYPLHDGPPDVQGRVERFPSPTHIGDQNNVSVDQEMQKLAENQIKYEAASKMLKKKFSSLQYVIRK
jgi:flagellar basal-body rod protein FlgB